MARKSSSPPPEPPPLLLTVSRDDAAAKLDDRIGKGQQLKKRSYNDWDDLEQSRKEYYKWSSYNTELLKRLFTSAELSDEYTREFGFVVGRDLTFGEEVGEHHGAIGEKIHRLESIKDRLELIPVAPEAENALSVATSTPAAVKSGKSVFIVHGHDEAARETTARYVERLGLEPVILHEQVNQGRTIIEKLEHSSNVEFAIVLLTPDDVGAPAGAKDRLNSRARQNVVLELGYFVGKLGRARVCALHKGEIELPSDFLGVVYVPMDNAGGWRLLLAKELKAAGFSIDLNAAV
jgi:predicted nucleotide-binding protein